MRINILPQPSLESTERGPLDALRAWARERIKSCNIGGAVLAAVSAFTRYNGSADSSTEVLCRELGEAHERIAQLEAAKAVAEQRAEGAHVEQSGFLELVGHELRTPLNAIIGFSDALLSEGTETVFGGDLTPKQREAIESVLLAGERLSGVVDSILDLTQIGAEGLAIEQEPCNISGIVTEVTAMSQADTDNKSIENNIDTERSLIVTGDREYIKQIIAHLVSNAMKFANNEVAIFSEILADGSLAICVQDDGCGIAKNEIDQALKNFGQVNRGQNGTKHEGIGLGLSIVQKLAGLHGFGLHLASDGHGKGVTASIIIPSNKFQIDGQVQVCAAE